MIGALDGDTFAGVTIVDLTRLLPGPFATMLFADLGARVIKVEAPQGGDYARWTPPQVDTRPGGFGAFFEALNRGKESVGLDLKTDAGLACLRDLLKRADVLVESFRPGVLERLGFSAETLREINPRLIVCAISSYGQTGPLAQRAGHDLNFLARSGALGLTGPADGVPAIPAVQVGDLAGGALQAAFAVAAALFRRERTGAGAYLDIAMAEGVLSMLGPTANGFAVTGRAPHRGQDALTGAFPCYRVYRTADQRFLAVAALEPKFWAAFVNAIGHPEWARDGLLTGTEGDEAAARVQAVLETKPLEAWTALLAPLDTCVEPVLSLEEVVADAHHQVRGTVRTAGERLHVVPPTSLAVAGLEDRLAPLLGEHTRAVAEELGWASDAIEGAVTSGAFASTSR